MIIISSKIRLDAMSKVISFSISDRYLDKLRSLYPALTDNLAVKQFVTDRLDGSLGNSLDDALDDGLDDRVKTLIESWVDGLLEVRLDASVGKLITSLSERMARLEERLDDSLDGSLDDMEPLLKREREASIATSPIVEPTGETSPLPPDKLGEGGKPHTPDSPPSPLDQPAIETLTPEVSPSPPSPVKEAIETDDREWLTLQQIADKKIKGLPGTYQGLRPYAEKWESRKNPQKKGEQYKIPKEYL